MQEKDWLSLFVVLSDAWLLAVAFYFGARFGFEKNYRQLLKTSSCTVVTSCYAEKEYLCLCGFPTEQWDVNLPAEEVPPDLPEPALGINFAREGICQYMSS